MIETTHFISNKEMKKKKENDFKYKRKGER